MDLSILADDIKFVCLYLSLVAILYVGVPLMARGACFILTKICQSIILVFYTKTLKPINHVVYMGAIQLANGCYLSIPKAIPILKPSESPASLQTRMLLVPLALVLVVSICRLLCWILFNLQSRDGSLNYVLWFDPTVLIPGLGIPGPFPDIGLLDPISFSTTFAVVGSMQCEVFAVVATLTLLSAVTHVAIKILLVLFVSFRNLICNLFRKTYGIRRSISGILNGSKILVKRFPVGFYFLVVIGCFTSIVAGGESDLLSRITRPFEKSDRMFSGGVGVKAWEQYLLFKELFIGVVTSISVSVAMSMPRMDGFTLVDIITSRKPIPTDADSWNQLIGHALLFVCNGVALSKIRRVSSKGGRAMWIALRKAMAKGDVGTLATFQSEVFSYRLPSDSHPGSSLDLMTNKIEHLESNGCPVSAQQKRNIILNALNLEPIYKHLSTAIASENVETSDEDLSDSDSSDDGISAGGLTSPGAPYRHPNMRPPGNAPDTPALNPSVSNPTPDLATPAGRKDFEKAMMKSVMKSVMSKLTLAPKTKRSSKVDTSDVVFDRLKRRIITEFETSIAPMLAKNRAERANLAFLNQEKENLALLLSQKNRKPRTDLANLSDTGDKSKYALQCFRCGVAGHKGKNCKATDRVTDDKFVCMACGGHHRPSFSNCGEAKFKAYLALNRKPESQSESANVAAVEAGASSSVEADSDLSFDNVQYGVSVVDTTMIDHVYLWFRWIISVLSQSRIRLLFIFLLIGPMLVSGYETLPGYGKVQSDTEFALHSTVDPKETTIKGIMDSGCSWFMCNDEAYMTDIDRRPSVQKRFKHAGNQTMLSEGIGKLHIPKRNVLSGEIDIITCPQAALVPKAAYNLWSVPQFKQGCCEVNGCPINLYYSNATNRLHDLDSEFFSYKIVEQSGTNLPFLVSDKCGPESDDTDLAMSVSEETDPNDWMLRRDEFTVLNSTYGPFDVELFTDNEKHNAQLPEACITEEENCFSKMWRGRRVYGNIPFEEKMLERALSYGLEEFQADPLNTTLCFVVPMWTNQKWWKYVKYFEQVKIYDRGTELFTIPQSKLTTNHSKSIDGRHMVGPTKWPVVVLYKDWTSPVQIDDALLAHLRFGHVCNRTLRHMVSEGYNLGMPNLTTTDFDSECFCSVCCSYKSSRLKPNTPNAPHRSKTQKKFQKDRSRTRSTKPFELVFADIWGPAPVTSAGGYRYLIGFIDDCTRDCKVYPMKCKSEACDRFREYCAYAKSRGGGSKPDFCLNTLQTDNAKEFTGVKFTEAANELNVVTRQTAPYLHENNAIIERLWRTLNSRANCLLMTADMEKDMWPLAWRHACYLYNRLPHSGLGMISPYEKLYGKRPDLSQIRVFGCACYSDVDDGLRNKFEPDTTPGIYTGHPDSSSVSSLVKNLTTGNVEPKGITRFFENTPEAARVISNPYTQRNFEESSPTKPEKLTGPVCNRSRVVGIDEIFDHSPLFVRKDKETHAWVQVTSQALLVPTWISLKCLLESSLENWDLFDRYMKNRISRGSLKTNADYPLFATVNHRSEDGGIYRGHIISTDPGGELQYQISILDPDSPDGISSIDVSAESIVEFSCDGAYSAVISNRYSKYCEPRNVSHAQGYPDWPKWKDSIVSEVTSLDDRGVFKELANTVPAGQNVIGTRFVLKLKLDEMGEIIKYKARMVAKGFMETFGVDFDQTFAPVAPLETIRASLILGLQHDMHIFTGDVSTAFLYGKMKQPIWCEFPEGTEYKGFKYFCTDTAVYGFRQSPREWNKVFNEAILSTDPDIRRNRADASVYQIWKPDFKAIIVVYVDDILVLSTDSEWGEKFMTKLGDRFKFTWTPSISLLCGMEIDYNREKGECQINLAHKIIHTLSQYEMANATPVDIPMDPSFNYDPVAEDNVSPDVPYRQLLGSLLWIGRTARPDIIPSVMILARYSSNFTIYHWHALVRILKYLKGTVDQKLVFTRMTNDEIKRYRTRSKDINLSKLEKNTVPIEQFSDSDWATCRLTRRSMTGNCTFLYNNLVTWLSARQDVVARSTVESEYVAVGTATRDGAYLLSFLRDMMGEDAVMSIGLYCDNEGAIANSLNEVNNSRTKHIDVRHHIIREKIACGDYGLRKVPTLDNVADLFTKPLKLPLFSKFRELLFRSTK